MKCAVFRRHLWLIVLRKNRTLSSSIQESRAIAGRTARCTLASLKSRQRTAYPIIGLTLALIAKVSEQIVHRKGSKYRFFRFFRLYRVVSVSVTNEIGLGYQLFLSIILYISSVYCF